VVGHSTAPAQWSHHFYIQSPLARVPMDYMILPIAFKNLFSSFYRFSLYFFFSFFFLFFSFYLIFDQGPIRILIKTVGEINERLSHRNLASLFNHQLTISAHFWPFFFERKLNLPFLNQLKMITAQFAPIHENSLFKWHTSPPKTPS
jgi:hypothetical protein